MLACSHGSGQHHDAPSESLHVQVLRPPSGLQIFTFPARETQACSACAQGPLSSLLMIPMSSLACSHCSSLQGLLPASSACKGHQPAAIQRSPLLLGSSSIKRHAYVPQALAPGGSSSRSSQQQPQQADRVLQQQQTLSEQHGGNFEEHWKLINSVQPLSCDPPPVQSLLLVARAAEHKSERKRVGGSKLETLQVCCNGIRAYALPERGPLALARLQFSRLPICVLAHTHTSHACILTHVYARILAHVHAAMGNGCPRQAAGPT